jgi:Pheromone A receptor
MYHIWTKGQEIRSIMGSSTDSPDYNQYIRLFMLCGIDSLITISLNIWYFRTWFPTYPWPGWKLIHSNWSQISFATAAELAGAPQALYQLEIARWVCVGYGFIFFGFFGIAAEARTNYASACRCVSKVFWWKTGFPGESFKYVLGFVLFQYISCDSIDSQPPGHRRVMTADT